MWRMRRTRYVEELALGPGTDLPGHTVEMPPASWVGLSIRDNKRTVPSTESVLITLLMLPKCEPLSVWGARHCTTSYLGPFTDHTTCLLVVCCATNMVMYRAASVPWPQDSERWRGKASCAPSAVLALGSHPSIHCEWWEWLCFSEV